MDAVDVYVDFGELNRIAGELRAAVGQFADIGQPAGIRADAGEMGGWEVSDAVGELGLRWQRKFDSLEQNLTDSATQAELAVRTYVSTEADLALRCPDGTGSSVSEGVPPREAQHGSSGSW
jgi:hypothetical protein